MNRWSKIVSGYLIRGIGEQVQVIRPGAQAPSFYVASEDEAVAMIEIDRQQEEPPRIHCADCSAEHCPCVSA